MRPQDRSGTTKYLKIHYLLNKYFAVHARAYARVITQYNT